jgi:predicted nucleotidyltransferase
VEFDIDKDKKDSLVEKAKYILPILQKLEQRLPTYLSDVAKRSINVDEYFQNLRQFWSNVLDESIIASHDNPLKYKQELEILKKKAEEALKSRQKVEQQEKDNLLNAEQEAQRIKHEYKKRVLIEEARDFVRQGEILFKERQHNFSKQEWAQINVWFSYQFTKVVDIYESTLGGIGQLLDSTLSVPTNIVVNFTSTQISQIGKLLVLIGGVVIIGLMTMFLVKLFIRKVINLFGFGEKQV